MSPTWVLTALLLSAAPVVSLTPGRPVPGEEPVSLEVEGLVVPAPGRRAMFLLGHLGIPSRSLRALLLRSDDGGAHWREVLPLVEDSTVLRVHFVRCEGRAWVGWTTEGPGDLTLYASSDCGATWRRRGHLEKEVHTEWLEEASWESSSRGWVWLRDTADEQAPLRVLGTHDGGRTWSVEPAPPSLPKHDEPLSERDARGVTWELSADEQHFRVNRQAPGAPVEQRSVLPRHWRVRGARLVPESP